jgi:hypothetical protein
MNIYWSFKANVLHPNPLKVIKEKNRKQIKEKKKTCPQVEPQSFLAAIVFDISHF